jgi:hypothetical protein
MTMEARCAALCLAYPKGYITGPTAGRLAKTRRMPDDGLIHFAVPHGTHIGPFPGVKIRQTTKVDKSHTTLRADGIRVATAARLAFDLAQDLSMEDHRSVVESHPELQIAEGLRLRGVPVELQVSYLKLPNGKRIRLDMAVSHVRWAVEVDVHPDHLLLDGTTKDKQRDRWCHRIDWQVERVTELDILDLTALCDELAELYLHRCETLRLRG